MIIWVVTKTNEYTYNRVGSCGSLFCYYFEHEIYPKAKKFRGHIFLSAEKAIDFMAREGKKYEYRRHYSRAL